MGREVRRVPKDWEHPKNAEGMYIPLSDGYKDWVAGWDKEAADWEAGIFPDYVSEESKSLSYEEYEGPRPDPEDYMPEWDESEKTHYMMYEDTSEGTPISPAFETPEELARWLADTGASAFGGSTASYEGWLRVANGGFAPSMVVIPGVGLVSGVDM